MGEREIILQLNHLFDKYKIPYLLTGSFASSYYGFPRATHDIDFVIEIYKKDYSSIEKVLGELDKSFIFDLGEVKSAVENSSQFNIFHLESGVKIDFWLSGQDDFEKVKFRRRRQFILNNQKIHLISPEDLILTKLLWCKNIKSERHLRDCIGIWKIQDEKLDKKYLLNWAKKFGLLQLLKKISSSEY